MTREPTQFIEMLKVRYGSNWQIVKGSALQGSFLHPNMTRFSRAKALTASRFYNIHGKAQ